MEDTALREQLVQNLLIGHAHMPFTEAVSNFPKDSINTIPTHVDYSFWHLLEHIRISQHDILDFIKNPQYKEIEWPKDYWPDKSTIATMTDWNRTINKFKEDQEELVKIIKTKKTNLYSKIPHGQGQTILREILLVIDHNAYHIGEFSILRQVMQLWPKKRLQ